MKKIYATEVQRLGIDNHKQLLQLPKEHIDRLTALEEAFQSEGDLKALLAVRKERERFTANPSVDDIVVAQSPARLGVLLQSYITTYNTVRADKEVQLKELKEKYLRALERVQKDLTRQNKIEEALAVMAEIEKVKRGAGTSPGTPAEPPPERAGPAPVETVELSLAQVRAALNGKVTGWNPRTGELSVEYDFRESGQAADWRGGRIDEIDAALICDNEAALFVLPFASLSKISFQALFRGDAERVRLSIGRQLHVDIMGDDEARSIVWQGSDRNPIVTRTDALRSAIANRAEVTLSPSTVALMVNYGESRQAPFQAPLMPPFTVSLGFPQGACAFQRVALTGILTPEARDYLGRTAR